MSINPLTYNDSLTYLTTFKLYVSLQVIGAIPIAKISSTNSNEGLPAESVIY